MSTRENIEPKQVTLRAAVIGAAATVGAGLFLWNFAEGIFVWKFRADLDHAETSPIKARVAVLERSKEEQEILFGPAFHERRQEALAAQQALDLLRSGKLERVE